MRTMICPQCWGSKKFSGGPCNYCSANGYCADLQLSANFWLNEMLKSDTAVRKGISNAPTPVEVAHCQTLCQELLQPIREGYGTVIVTSGIRMPALNSIIGGSAAHPSGFAADIHSPNGTRKALVDYIVKKFGNKMFDQVIFEGTWVHISRHSPDGTRTRGEVLATFDAGKSYVQYDPNDPRVDS